MIFQLCEMTIYISSFSLYKRFWKLDYLNEITFNTRDEKHYDQSRKAFGARYGDHLTPRKYGKSEKSSVADMMMF